MTFRDDGLPHGSGLALVIVGMAVSCRCRSLGGGPTWPTQGPQATLNVALDNLAAAGLLIVVSAGNDGGLDPLSLGM